MNHNENEFIGEKAFRIFYQSWLPDEKPKAIIQIVHGFGEHSGRYMNIVNKLVPLNYGIYANDHRGNGKSDGTTNYVESFEFYVRDLKRLSDLIKENHPEVPIFMLGHSMGSGIAMTFANKYQELLKGLILSGTGTTLGEEVSPLLKLMSKVISKILPKMEIDPKLDPETLSHDPEVVKAYKEDPLVHYEKITTRLGSEMLKTFSNLESVVKDLHIPLLIQIGSEDKAVHGSDELITFMKMEDKTVKIYEGLFHEVYNETTNEREKVLNDLVNWLESHL
ncbi:MAG: lysophospholipase [Candidatus Lokiarchaeota archaeon]